MHIEVRDDEFCVIDDDTGDDVGCFASRPEAMERMAEIMGDEGEQSVSGEAFHVGLVVEGLLTADRRYLELGETTWRETPIPLMFQDQNPDGGMGHDGAWFAGAIESVERDSADPSKIVGHGHLRAGARGEEAAQMIRDGLNGVSIDPSVETVVFDVQGTDVTGAPIVIQRYRNARIMGATVVNFGAQEAPAIWLDGQEPPERWATAHGEHLPENGMPEPEDDDIMLLLASASLAKPPAAWFETAEQCYEALADESGRVLYDVDGEEILVGPFALDAVPAERRRACALTVDDDGRVYGHAAAWGTCHIGYPDVCVTPPESPAGYRHFHTGEREVIGGRVACGALTIGTGHAGPGLSATAAAAHYDNTGTAVADVRAKDAELGIWCAGALRTTATPDDVRTLMASAPSGDWRRIGGYLECIAVLAVNVPGFPIPRPQAVTAGGVQTSLVAAGIPPASIHRDHDALAQIRSEVEALRIEVAALRRVADPLRPLAASALIDQL